MTPKYCEFDDTNGNIPMTASRKKAPSSPRPFVDLRDTFRLSQVQRSRRSSEQSQDLDMSDSREGSPAAVSSPSETSRRIVRFADHDTLVQVTETREKFSEEEKADLFYTQLDSIRFQYGFDRENARAVSCSMSWYDWKVNSDMPLSDDDCDDECYLADGDDLFTDPFPSDDAISQPVMAYRTNEFGDFYNDEDEDDGF